MPTASRAYDKSEWHFALQTPIILCISRILCAAAACSHTLYLPDTEICDLWALVCFYQEKLKIFPKLFWELFFRNSEAHWKQEKKCIGGSLWDSTRETAWGFNRRFSYNQILTICLEFHVQKDRKVVTNLWRYKLFDKWLMFVTWVEGGTITLRPCDRPSDPGHHLWLDLWWSAYSKQLVKNSISKIEIHIGFS